MRLHPRPLRDSMTLLSRRLVQGLVPTGLLLTLAAPSPSAQVAYRLSFDLASDAGPPSWSVEASFPSTGEEIVDLWFPRWTAGAYHLADFGRFVEGLTAYGAAGDPLGIERVTDSHYRVMTGKADRFVVRYGAASLSKETFTDGVIDVEANRITDRYAYVNPASLFAFVPELLDVPITLATELPEGWEAATALRKDAAGRYVSPGFLRFEDSPLLFSPELRTARFQVAGRPHAVSVVGRSQEDTERIAAGCRRIVEATDELANGLPYSHYHFLYVFASKQGMSGLEHSFSTLILAPEGIPLSDASTGFWGVTAHEFFHAWTPERIHVASLHSPDYTRPLVTDTIWFNEGVTEYVTQHILMHAGFLTPERLLTELGVQPFHGHGREVPWTEVSRTAAHWTEGEGIMRFATAMYGTGPKVVFALDMEMRRASDGERGLIDLIRYLRRAYVDADRGFEEGTLIHMINGIAQADLSELYDRTIAGLEYPDLDRALEVIGYTNRGGRLAEVSEPSEDQLEAREDFLSIP